MHYSRPLLAVLCILGTTATWADENISIDETVYEQRIENFVDQFVGEGASSKIDCRPICGSKFCCVAIELRVLDEGQMSLKPEEESQIKGVRCGCGPTNGCASGTCCCKVEF